MCNPNYLLLKIKSEGRASVFRILSFFHSHGAPQIICHGRIPLAQELSGPATTDMAKRAWGGSVKTLGNFWLYCLLKWELLKLRVHLHALICLQG